jgi:hypothetical protein
MTRARDRANGTYIDSYVNNSYGPDVSNSSTTVPVATGFPIFKVPAKAGDVLIFNLFGSWDGFDMMASFDLRISKSGIYWGSGTTSFRSIASFNPPSLYSVVRGLASRRVAAGDIDADGTVSVTLMCLKSSGSANTNRFGLNENITSASLINMGSDYVI